MEEGYEAMGDAVGAGYRRAEGLIERYPTPSVLVGFGFGFGLGVLLAVAMTEREEPWWREWGFSDSLRHLQNRIGQLQDRLGHLMS
jgi:hypothetical protein